MTDLDKITTRELIKEMKRQRFGVLGMDAVIDEAARRLSRYAPVKIDPEDEGTWPTEGGLEFWSVKRQEWLRDAPTRSELAEGLATYYRRINNESPEG